MSDAPVVVKLGGTTIIDQQDVLREIVEDATRTSMAGSPGSVSSRRTV